MHIIFCVDRGVLPGLHVAAYSLLDRIHPAAGDTHFSIFSDALHESDMVLLQRTLTAIGKPFALELRRLDPLSFVGFPTLNNSLATYYRLFAAQIMEVDRFLYVDADTLCDVDVSELQSFDMKSAPVAWVPACECIRMAEAKGDGKCHGVYCPMSSGVLGPVSLELCSLPEGTGPG